MTVFCDCSFDYTALLIIQQCAVLQKVSLLSQATKQDRLFCVRSLDAESSPILRAI